MRIAFWNTHKNKKINEVIRQLILEERIDLMVMAEYSDADGLKSLVSSLYGYKMCLTPGCKRISMVGRISDIEPGATQEHYAIQIINHNLILCALHLNSKIFSDADDRRQFELHEIKKRIVQHEEKYKTKNAIILGDFNENPYEKSIMGINGLCGVPIARKVSTKPRKVAGVPVDMYYNPMWHFLGDYDEPYGTYYFPSEAPYWNVFDQVLLSSSLSKDFSKKELRIVTKIADTNLKNKDGSPNKRLYSDHFPVVFEIGE